jgi:CRP/FNR family cyclic AMP-dependent transcriptional regulator
VLSLTLRKRRNCIIRLSFNQKAIDIAPLDARGWLADQPAAMINWVASVGRWQTYDTGQIVYQAGDAANGLYGLASGGLELSFPLVSDEPVTIYRAEIGFWIGDSAELSGRPRMVSLIAAGPTRLLHIPSQEVAAMLARYPQYWRSFYELSARNVNAAMSLLAESLALTVRARVCRRLLFLGGKETNVEITQESLAKLLGVTRATLRRALVELAQEGGVETGYGSLRVADAAILRRYIDEQ